MPYVEHADAKIYYEQVGSGFPVMTIAPGGLFSSISRWSQVEWNPLEFLSDSFTVIASDLRSSGKSYGQMSKNTSWKDLEADIIAVMDHAGINQAHVLGMCIGGAMTIGMLVNYSDRFVSGVPVQTIGVADNIAAFAENMGKWEKDYVLHSHPEDVDGLHQFWNNLLQGEFIFNSVSREDVKQIKQPLLVLQGNDVYHPQVISDEIAALAPHGELVTYWKQDKSAGQQRVKEFLLEHTPVGAIG